MHFLLSLSFRLCNLFYSNSADFASEFLKIAGFAQRRRQIISMVYVHALLVGSFPRKSIGEKIFIKSPPGTGACTGKSARRATPTTPAPKTGAKVAGASPPRPRWVAVRGGGFGLRQN
ncbi:MAG: hypothetical protein LBJ11_08810 [Oscillospiraceae bacterium]|nr:hypothetical protein [Oscillospiraceae bacterium]